MKRFLLALFVASLVALPAHATAPNTAGLALASNGSGQASFAVTLNKKNVNRYSLWVANLCTDAAGVTVTAEYHAVVWSGDDGSAGPFATDGTNPATGPIVACHAYVWLFPAPSQPVSNTVSYTP